MPSTLIYDGECPLCLKAVEWVRRNAAPDTVDTITCQSDERAQRFPDLPESQCMEAMQLITPDGTVFAGDEALPELLLLLRRWRWVARLFKLPGVTLLAPHAYGFIARNRYVFSVLVARKHEPCNEEQCSTGDDTP